jgi:hypothetical protein
VGWRIVVIDGKPTIEIAHNFRIAFKGHEVITVSRVARSQRQSAGFQVANFYVSFEHVGEYVRCSKSAPLLGSKGTLVKLSYKAMSALALNPALAAAREEKSYRGQCQAMAWVARYVRDQRHVAPTALAAAEAAAQDEDAYGAVFVLAWPIRALLERGEPKVAAHMLAGAIEKAAVVTPAASQSEALFMLMQAAMFGEERNLWMLTFKALLASSFPSVNWRQGRNVRDAICMAAAIDFPFAKLAAEGLPDEKLKTNVLSLLSQNKKQKPRPFFW